MTTLTSRSPPAPHTTPALLAMLEDRELAGTAIRVPTGQLLFGPEFRPRRVYLIVSGLFRVLDPPDGGRRIARTIDWLGPGDFIGWVAITGRPQDRFRVRAERESALIPLPLGYLVRRMARQPRLGLEIIAQLVRRLNNSYIEMAELVRLQTPQRLANCLQRLAAHPALAQAEGRWTIIRLTHADLASRTGISRETVSLILSRWRRAAIVRTGRGKLAVDLVRLGELLAHFRSRHVAE